MLLPLPLPYDIAFPWGEQVVNLPGPVTEGGSGTTYRCGLQTNDLQCREERSTAGQQGAAYLHPEKMYKS